MHFLFVSVSCSQCSWRAATASPSTAWRACESSSSPPRWVNITCPWPTPATTCWTCPATRAKRSCAIDWLRLWSSTRASAWSEDGEVHTLTAIHTTHISGHKQRFESLTLNQLTGVRSSLNLKVYWCKCRSIFSLHRWCRRFATTSRPFCRNKEFVLSI